MRTENFWKIMDITNNVTVLTFVPKEYGNGDGVYKLMKKLQKVFGPTLCSCQKYDERFDRIEDFDVILRVHYNLRGERLIQADLFEYDKETETLTINRQQKRRVYHSNTFVYSFRTRGCVYAMNGWDGLRRHLCDWQNFSVGEFNSLGTHSLLELETKDRTPQIEFIEVA